MTRGVSEALADGREIEFTVTGRRSGRQISRLVWFVQQDNRGVPILDLITERETAAGITAERLPEQIATLTDQFALAETEMAELAITRKDAAQPDRPSRSGGPR